jgi:hypothetical protein
VNKILLFVLLLILIVVLSFHASAERTSDITLEVEFEPENMVVDEDEGRVRFTVTNDGPETVRVAFLTGGEGFPEGLDGYFTTVLATIAPGEVARSTLVLYTLKPGTPIPEGKVVVEVVWGSHLELMGTVDADPSTVEGSWRRSFKVMDEFPSIYGPFTYFVMLLVVAVIIFFLLYPMWTERLEMQKIEDTDPPT